VGEAAVNPGISPSSSELKFEIGHVLFIDIVGYSKLLLDEQKERLHQLTDIVLTTSQVLEATNEQLIRLPTGDGMALVFRNSSEEPARCALEIAHALKAHREILIRMGIHSGPVSEVTDVSGRTNIAGAGINSAQRVMDCGDAGHILLSQRVADDLAQYRQWSTYLHDLGECEVKHDVRIQVVNLYSDDVGNSAIPTKLRRATMARTAKRWKLTIAITGAVIFFAVGALYYRSLRAAPLTDKDTVLLADFTNSTGDPVFDATLRQGLAVQLEQSPFLSLVPDSQITQTLGLMGRPADAKLSPDIARELCQRIGSKAFIAGSIASLGSEYVIGLRAVNSRSSATIAEEQVQASAKEKVLDALSRGATKLREKLGESLGTLQKFDTPLEQATTTSLEALQAYQFGAALAFALEGDAVEAQKLADDLAKRFPEDTEVQFNYLPSLRAQLALVRNEPSAAINALEIASPYELGVPNQAAFAPAFYPVYIRGQTYLAEKNGPAAASEFQKILDHRGVVFNEIIGALAHLGVARAYTLQGDGAKARTAYNDFFALWKNADSEVPILKQAKAEYAKL
jgi:class 3 adenylate cyclase